MCFALPFKTPIVFSSSKPLTTATLLSLFLILTNFKNPETKTKEAEIMESIQDALFTAAMSFIFCFILAKLVSMASFANVEQDSVVMEKREFEGELRSRGLCSERRFEFVGESVKVGEFGGELVQELLEIVRGGDESSADDSQITVEEEGLGEDVKVSGLEEKTVENLKSGDSNSGDVLEEHVSSRVGVLEDKLVEERLEKTEVHEIDLELALDETILAKNEKGGVVGYEGDLGNEIEGAKKNKANDEKEGLFNDYEDWEGIERTELEKIFGDAVTFVGSGDHDGLLSSVGNDVQMQLYGLHKVATEGPCHDSKPMALKVSSRAKWNAWKRLGNMSLEVAMEQYIALLSDSVPGWMGENPGGDSKQDSPEGVFGIQAPDLRTFIRHQLGSANEGNQKN